ncbi:hypothetical protein DM860_001995 [Cuscuta australis]|uniref:Uncharacterized protein n=1 Tax=Cuscuta australis TaxID=267555 RepID=A0A328DVI3_9ASTE|nr:hypothetical protein DM860_001995 [Cuscuta australis]
MGCQVTCNQHSFESLDIEKHPEVDLRERWDPAHAVISPLAGRGHDGVHFIGNSHQNSSTRSEGGNSRVGVPSEGEVGSNTQHGSLISSVVLLWWLQGEADPGKKVKFHNLGV